MVIACQPTSTRLRGACEPRRVPLRSLPSFRLCIRTRCPTVAGVCRCVPPQLGQDEESQAAAFTFYSEISRVPALIDRTVSTHQAIQKVFQVRFFLFVNGAGANRCQARPASSGTTLLQDYRAVRAEQRPTPKTLRCWMLFPYMNSHLDCCHGVVVSVRG